ncbi:MAG: MATE family efflux transporter [Eubacteriales bacterium]|nr:MATE family efflux transporter [Eubacteriales bacterium]
MGKLEKDLSQGNVAVRLIGFALPCLLSNIVQLLYSVADMIIVGQFSGTAGMSGVNIGSQATFLITNMVFGLSVGATVLVAQYLGAGKRDALRETIGTLFTSLLVAGVSLTVIMTVLGVPLLKLIRTPVGSFDEARSYLFITMLGTIFIFGYNALSSVMRGMGNSRGPLVFISIACAANILLDLLMVAAFGWGAAGAALATVLSQALSVFLCIIYLMKNDFIFDFKLKSFRFHRERLRLILKIGIPASIQNVATSVSFLFLTALVNTFGVTASAAVGAVGKLNGFAILPAIAMSTSVSAMSAQNIGAGSYKRAVQTLYTGIAIAMAISVVIFALMRSMPEKWLLIFGDDAEMIEKGVIYLRSFSYDYLVVPFVFCMNGLFTGAGHTAFSLFNSSMAALLVRIPSAWILGMVMGQGLAGVGLGAPIASVAALITGTIYFASGRWKTRVILKTQVA